MTHRLILRTAMALGLCAPLASALADQNPLVEERWKTRPVVVVVPRADAPLLAQVRAALAEPAMREGFIERDMALYTVVAGEGRRNDQPLGPARTRALLQALQLQAQGPETFVLVGKDGGVKRRDRPPVDLREIFAEVDRMPMRQQRRGHGRAWLGGTRAAGSGFDVLLI